MSSIPLRCRVNDCTRVEVTRNFTTVILHTFVVIHPTIDVTTADVDIGVISRRK